MSPTFFFSWLYLLIHLCQFCFTDSMHVCVFERIRLCNHGHSWEAHPLSERWCPHHHSVWVPIYIYHRERKSGWETAHLEVSPHHAEIITVPPPLSFLHIYTCFFTIKSQYPQGNRTELCWMSVISHLWRCAGGQASAELSDPGCCCGVRGADQNRATDLHGVSLWWRSQAGLMGHSQWGEGVSLLTVLLLSGGFLGAIGLRARGRRGRCFTRVSSSFRWFVQFYELSRCTVKLKRVNRTIFYSI